MINLKKELIVFLVLFIVSSLLVHNAEWISNPIEHFSALSTHPMPYHPFLYVFLIYIVVSLLRGIISLVKKPSRKQKALFKALFDAVQN